MKWHFSVILAYAFSLVMQVVTYKNIFTWRKINFSILWKLAFLFFYLVLYSCSEREHLVNRISSEKRNHAIDNQKVIFRFYLMPWLNWLKETLVRTYFIMFKPSFKTLSKLDWSSWKFPAWNETQSGLLESSSASNSFRILSLWSPAQVHLREGRRHIHQDSPCKLLIINMMNNFGYGIPTDIGRFEIFKSFALRMGSWTFMKTWVHTFNRLRRRYAVTLPYIEQCNFTCRHDPEFLESR